MFADTNRTATAVMMLLVLGACAAPAVQDDAAQQATAASTPVVYDRTELVVLRRPSGYSDVALMDIEEGTYIWKPQEVSPFGIQLSFDGSDGTRLLHTVYFNTDSATISRSEKQRLQAILSEIPDSGVVLSGYADPRASSAYNMKLSRRRADAVADYLGYHSVVVDKECAYGKDRLPDVQLCEE